MSIKIETARREQTNTLTALVGPSGSGKTYSAILMARGLVGQAGKIGLIDTENRRALHYAELAGGFDHADLRPPFSPARFIEAIKTFEAAGYHALIIDSLSHEWEGEGGVCRMAEEIAGDRLEVPFGCWKRPKSEHRKFVSCVLQARMHIILCVRAKEKRQQVRVDGKTEIISRGLQPITDESVIYEMTASVMIDPETHGITHMKVPADLAAAFPEGKRIGFETGQKLREWSEHGVAVDVETQRTKDDARAAAFSGMEALKQFTKALNKGDRAVVDTIRDELGSIARAADEAAAMVEATKGPPPEKIIQLDRGSE